ncbi:unnamed protein product [Ophioblennius macclurei]
MTLWRNKTCLLSLFFLQITFNLSNQACHNYLRLENMIHLTSRDSKWTNCVFGDKEKYSMKNLDNLTEVLTGDIELIQTKNPNDMFECSLYRKCRDEGKYCVLLCDCFLTSTGDDVHWEKCEGNSFQNISFYQYICTLAKIEHWTDRLGVCKNFNAEWSYVPPTIPTAAAAATTTAPPLNPTSAQPSPTKKIPSKNGTRDKRFSDSTAVNSGWKTACIVLLVVCSVLACCLCYSMWHNRKKPSKALQPDANGIRPESSSFIQVETSPCSNGLHYSQDC